MSNIVRDLTEIILNKLRPQKVFILLGARRVGKTILIGSILDRIDAPKLILNGEDINVHDMLESRSIEKYRQLIGSNKYLYIDEAQKIPDIGQKLKLMIDEIPGLTMMITGSSALDVNQNAGEPLTGRKFTFNLFGLSENEYKQVDKSFERKERLKERMVLGNYPELLQIPDRKDKIEYLNDLVSSYLLKDILAYENIKNSHTMFNLLRLVSFRIGNEVSLNELGQQLGISKNTVEKYLDLLCKVFILHRVEGYSKNLRKEITKSSRWYFLDNGIRNAVIANFNPLETRNDIGMLWENYMIAERLKYQQYNRMSSNNYFWRTYSQQEIDWVEERDGSLFGFEMNWKPQKIKVPPQWAKAYPDAQYEVIHVDNYEEWLS